MNKWKLKKYACTNNSNIYVDTDNRNKYAVLKKLLPFIIVYPKWCVHKNSHIKKSWSRILKLVIYYTHYSVTYPEINILSLSHHHTMLRKVIFFMCLMTQNIIYSAQYFWILNTSWFSPVKSDQHTLFDNIFIEVLLRHIIYL